jgi:hypothetical protein
VIVDIPFIVPVVILASLVECFPVQPGPHASCVDAGVARNGVRPAADGGADRADNRVRSCAAVVRAEPAGAIPQTHGDRPCYGLGFGVGPAPLVAPALAAMQRDMRVAAGARKFGRARKAISTIVAQSPSLTEFDR